MSAKVLRQRCLGLAVQPQVSKAPQSVWWEADRTEGQGGRGAQLKRGLGGCS